jgi:hypothetical protein
MKILFLHGWRSVVGGVKPTYLKAHGHEVINPKLDDDDFESALRTAQAAFDAEQPDVIVGSSRGGAVALNINSKAVPLVLLCPAWKSWGTVQRLKPNAVILHSRQDDIIPFQDSEELIARSELSPDALLEVGHDHRLADESSLAVMLWACRQLATGGDQSWLDRDSSLQLGASGSESRDASYICDACGEEIVIPLDLTEGTSQKYVEDCPVCCRANVIHVEIHEAGAPRVWAEPEQDYD